MLRRLLLLAIALMLPNLASSEPAGWAISVISSKEAMVADVSSKVGDVQLTLADVPGFLRGADPDLTRTVYIRVLKPNETPYAVINALIAGLRRVGYLKVSFVTDEATPSPTRKSFDADKIKDLIEKKPPSDDGDLAKPAASPGSSAVQRPPGITRSGENDEFARNVIRALQKTMPRQEGQFGRVTARIVVPENSSPADVKVLKSSGNSDLDSNVIFAARQTAYPLPPKNSTVADRTFIVTYVYK